MLLLWLTCYTAKAFKSNVFYNVCTIWKCVFSIYSRWKMWALFCRLKAAVKIKHTHEIHFRLWHVALPAFQTTLVRCAFHWADCLWSFRIQDAKPTVYYFNPCSQTENKRNFTLHGQSVGERNSRKKSPENRFISWEIMASQYDISLYRWYFGLVDFKMEYLYIYYEIQIQIQNTRVCGCVSLSSIVYVKI